MKRTFFYLLIAILSFLALQCGSNKQSSNKTGANAEESLQVKTKTDTVLVLAGINSKGVGRFQNIQLTHPLDEKMGNLSVKMHCLP